MLGELDFTFRMNAAMSPCEWAVAVGLFGLHRNTMPAPFAASAIPSRSMLRSARTGTRRMSAPNVSAVRFVLRNDGVALTSGREGET